MQIRFLYRERYELFKKELNLIKDKYIREFTVFVLCDILYDNFFYLPSSSTGKYHNPQDNGYQGW